MKTKTLLLAILLICCLPAVSFATGQIGERIIIGQDTLEMLACPLETDSLLSRQVQERLSGKGVNTGLWRGYVGLWRLENGSLYLEKIQEQELTEKRLIYHDVDISGIFDAYLENDRILARWFSGDIRVVKGDCIAYEHMGFSRHYEYETVYTILNGRLKNEHPIHNSFRETANKHNLYTFSMLFNGNGMSWANDSSLFIAIYPRPDGSVSKVEITYSQRNKSKGISHKKQQIQLERIEKKNKRYHAKLEKANESRNPTKAKERLFDKYWGSRHKTYASNHPYTREARACAELMDGWQVLSLDGEIQPVRFFMRWGRDKSRWEDFYDRGKNYDDSLVVDGVAYRLKAYPLQQEPELLTRLRPHLKGAFRTAYPRGYCARWKIADNRLWLTELRNAHTGALIPLSVLSPDNNGEPIEATWYTGHFEAERGEPIGEKYPLNRIKRHEIELRVEQGRVVHRENHENHPSSL